MSQQAPAGRRAGCGTITAIGLVAGFALMAAVALLSPSEPEPPAAKTAGELAWEEDQVRIARAKATIVAALKDPESARWGEVFISRQGGEGPVVCGHVNARNGFGGYTGMQPFMATDEAVTPPQAKPSAAFVKRWNGICAGARTG